MGDLEIGIDSPVSDTSFIRSSPVMSKQSQGIFILFSSSIISPTTSSEAFIFFPSGNSVEAKEKSVQ